jgi:hypothetical protein
MSNVTLFNQNLPDYLKEVELDDMTKALAGNTSVKRISVRGGVFRMMVNGEEVAKNENRAMNVVVVNANPHVSRQFYAGTYVAGETTAPDCWSNDGIKPDASIEEPQNSACDGCPQNIKGSGQGDSKACRYQQKLAVVLESDISGDVFQLSLASTSIFGRGDLDKMPFQQYAKYVGSQGKNINTLVTEMRFDSDSATPKLVFKPVRFLNRDEWQAAKEKGNSPAAKSAVTQTPAQTDNAKPKAVAAPAKAQSTEPEIQEPTKKVAKKNIEPAAKKEFADVLNQWSTDDE